MNFNKKYVNVILPLKLKQELTYYVPETLIDSVSLGTWVNVRLKGKKCLAVISGEDIDIKDIPEEKILSVDSVVELPIISNNEVLFWRQIADYYMCTVGEVFKAAYSSAFQRQLGSVKSKKKELAEKPLNEKMIPVLSTIQKQAYNQINSFFERNKVAFLYGVTGSGKTEIYITLALETLAKGKNVLYLAPEIAMTRQLKTRLEKVFGSSLLLFHSKQTVAGKKDVYSKISASGGRNYVILGTRSAVFLPHDNTGLIVVDEEHDSSYKQVDPAPRYNARDVAVMLATLNHIPILLGSATPSFETLYNVQQGKYCRTDILEKYHSSKAAEIEIVDMNMVRRLKNTKGSFSMKLINEIRSTIDKGNQVMIFRSRRSYSPFVQCSECGDVPECPRCSVSLSYHKYNNLLECHYCGYKVVFNAVCAKCGGTRVYRGTGTEKIEEELKEYFPDCNIARFDAETTEKKAIEQKILKDFDEGTIDILVGTQMISKGFDFEKLTLVAVIQADSLFSIQDFRADERAMQLLSQLRGRAGRRETQGKLIIQTSQPDHPVIKSFATMSTNMDERKLFSYPPFVRLILITVRDKFEWRLNQVSDDLIRCFKKCGIISYSGAVIPPVDRVNGQIINQFWIKLQKNQYLNEIKRNLANEVNVISEKYHNLPDISVDVDPY